MLPTRKFPHDSVYATSEVIIHEIWEPETDTKVTRWTYPDGTARFLVRVKNQPVIEWEEEL